MKRGEGGIYAIRTVAGQEVNVALMVESRAKVANIPIRAVLVIEGIKGMVFVEASDMHSVEQAISGIKHVRRRAVGRMVFEDIEPLVRPRPMVEKINVGDAVEVISGPFRGMKGRVVGMDREREEVTVELLEASYPFPILMPADYLKVIESKIKS